MKQVQKFIFGVSVLRGKLRNILGSRRDDISILSDEKEGFVDAQVVGLAKIGEKCAKCLQARNEKFGLDLSKV